MKAILDLEHFGYQFTLDDEQIRYTLAPGREVDQATVRPLLEELRRHKQEAIAYLRQRDLDQPLTSGTLDEMDNLGASIRERIRRKGYCLIKSAALGETLKVVENDHWRKLGPAGYVTYTLAELALLAEGYRAGHIVTIGDLRLLHEAKRRLGGVIMQ